MGSIRRILWGITACGSLAGGYTLLETMGTAASAPQQAAGTGMALAFAVIPYCLTRAVAEISKDA